MQKNLKRNIIFIFIGGGLLFGGGILLGFFISNRGDGNNGAEDTARVELIEGGIEGVGIGIKKIESRISETGKEFEFIGKEVKESRGFSKNIASGIDSITERNKKATGSIDRAEGACERIEQAINEIKKAE